MSYYHHNHSATSAPRASTISSVSDSSRHHGGISLQRDINKQVRRRRRPCLAHGAGCPASAFHAVTNPGSGEVALRTAITAVALAPWY